MTTGKAAPRRVRFADLEFAPRFEYGEMAEIAGISGSEDGSEFATGWGRLRNARIPWTIRYDELLTVFEGLLRVHANGETYELQPRDCLWLPRGTELVYEAESALVHFVIHPADWQQPA